MAGVRSMVFAAYVLLLPPYYFIDGFGVPNHQLRARPVAFGQASTSSRPFKALLRFETKLHGKRRPLLIRKRATEEVNKRTAQFGHGVADVGFRYWEHVSRQRAVGVVACLIMWKMSGVETFVKALQAFGRNRVLNTLPHFVTRSSHVVASYVVKREHKWYGFAHSVIGGPLMEEVIYRLLIFQTLKYCFQKRTGWDTDRGGTKRLLSPWSIITSLAFAAGHVDPHIMGYAIGWSSTPYGRSLLAKNCAVIAVTFFASLFMINPLYEKHGVFAAIGAHCFWNATAHVPRLGYILLAVHFLHRALVRYTEPWKTRPAQAYCDTFLETQVLFQSIGGIVAKVFS